MRAEARRQGTQQTGKQTDKHKAKEEVRKDGKEVWRN